MRSLSERVRSVPAALWLVPILAGGAFMRFQGARAAASFGGENYYALGLNLKQRSILAYPSNPRLPTAYRSPYYPSLIAALLPEGPAPFPRTVLYAQAALGTAMIAMLYILGAAVSSPLAGLLAAAFYAVDAEQISYATSLEIEHIHSFLILTVACALVYWVRRRSARSAWGLGAAIGFSLTCRSTLFLFPLVLALLVLSRKRPEIGERGHVPRILLALALPLLPWIARNAVEFRRFIPFERHAAACNLYTAAEGMVQTCLPGMAHAMAAVGDSSMLAMSEEQKNEELTRRAVVNIVTHPVRYLVSCLKRLAVLLSLHPWLWLLTWSALYLRRDDAAVCALGGLAVYFCAVVSLLSIEDRYLAPLTPVLLVLAMGGVAALAPRRDPTNGIAALRIALVGALAFSVVVGAISSAYLGAELFQEGRRNVPQVATTAEGVVPVQDARAGIEASPKAHNDRGVSRFLAGDFPGAVADFRAALALDPGYLESRLSLGAVLSRQGRHREALSSCRQAVESSSPAQTGDDWNKERFMLSMTALDCCANELRALGRLRQAGSFEEARRRALSAAVERLRSRPRR